jgi:hypothetical protein
MDVEAVKNAIASAIIATAGEAERAATERGQAPAILVAADATHHLSDALRLVVEAQTHRRLAD